MTITNISVSAAVAQFQKGYDELHRQYVGRPFDGAYRSAIEQMEHDLDAAIRSAPPITSVQDAASLIDLECMLFREFEGEEPIGVHATRLAGLEALRAI